MIKVNICEEEITISTEDDIEIVHWTHDEWEEDPTIIPCIANAIKMAYTDPKKLIGINITHINSQRGMIRYRSENG